MFVCFFSIAAQLHEQGPRRGQLRACLASQADRERIPAARSKLRHELLAPAPRRVERAVHKQQRRPRRLLALLTRPHTGDLGTTTSFKNQPWSRR